MAIGSAKICFFFADLTQDFRRIQVNTQKKAGHLPYEARPPQTRKKIAIIGSGIAGMSAAWLLNRDNDITVFEADDHIGGHSNTVDAGKDGKPLPVDTGFIVYNEQNYPNLVALFDHLNVPTKPSDMSFAASIDEGKFEYSGTGLNGLLAQRSNLVNPRFWAMMSDIVRFYKTAPTLDGIAATADVSLGDYLRENNYSDAFIRDHILPMGAAIWSTTVNDMLDYPLATFVRFFESHGLLKFKDRPKWRTVDGGSREYVKRLTASYRDRVKREGVVAVTRTIGGVEVMTTSGGQHLFDDVVLATHADEALTLLSNPSQSEQQLLGAFQYTDNDTYLHTDERLMPKRRRVWSSWNYIDDGAADAGKQLTLSYWMNRLQSIDKSNPLFVTLNPHVAPRDEMIIRKFSYQHPLFNAAAINAQKGLWQLQGRDRLWFCGSYFGYGFHEDALEAGLAVAEQLSGTLRPWNVTANSSRVNTEVVLPLAAD